MLSCIGTLPEDQLSQMLASHSLELTLLRQSAVLFAEADTKSTTEKKVVNKGGSNYQGGFFF